LKVIKLRGESGFVRGSTLGKNIRDVCIHNISFLEQRLVEEGLSLDYGLRLAFENEKVIAKHFPDMLEEMKGLAEGAGLPYSSILLETAFPFTVGVSSDCTIVSAYGVATTDSLPLVGRNYDFLSDFKKCNQLRIVKGRDKGFSFVGSTITMLGVEEGLNNAGLFIGDAGWEPREFPSSRGLSSRQIMQRVLEDCCSVDAAIDFIRQAPKFAGNAGACYLLADRRESVVIEMGLTRSCVRKSEEGMLVASNVLLTSIAEEMKPPEPTASTRYNFARRYFHENKGKMDIKSMREILSDHSSPICSHNEISTLRSMIAKVNEGRILVADGQPCTSRFEEISIPT